MIALIETLLRWAFHWASVLIVLNFLGACAEHECWLWIKRNPDKANRLAERVDGWLARWERRA